jgi:hypothetical protein
MLQRARPTPLYSHFIMVTAEHRAAVRKAYYKRNRDRINAYKRQYRRDNHEAYLAEQRRAYHSRVARDPAYRVKKNTSRRIRHALRRVGADKKSSTSSIIGCTAQELRAHLERQFKPGMSWDNYGESWEIDHRVPCAFFDHGEWQQVKQCHHFSNLQPMWKPENADKSSWFEGHRWTYTDHNGPSQPVHAAV